MLYIVITDICVGFADCFICLSPVQTIITHIFKITYGRSSSRNICSDIMVLLMSYCLNCAHCIVATIFGCFLREMPSLCQPIAIRVTATAVHPIPQYVSISVLCPSPPGGNCGTVLGWSLDISGYMYWTAAHPNPCFE
jgi:hypothetical protein